MALRATTTPATAAATHPPPGRHSRRRPPAATLTDARTTGLLYLALGIFGMLGFFIVRPQVFVATSDTLVADLVAAASLARAGVAFEIATVVAQALLAWWFVRLFRVTDPVTAGALGAFGVVNAALILVSATALATAIGVSTATADPAIGPIVALVALSEQLWGIGGVFFGLWLVPMGMLVLRTTGMPRPLGWLLVGGGAGYVASALVGQLAPGAPVLAELLTMPATAGEFWMIGYLLHGGVFRRAIST